MEVLPAPSVLGDLGRTPHGTATIQSALGRPLLDLNRATLEGGAHQSVTTPSIGLEQPGCLTYEPAFALDSVYRYHGLDTETIVGAALDLVD